MATKRTQSALLRAHEMYLRELDASLRDVFDRAMMSDDEGTVARVSDHLSWATLQRAATDDGWVAAKRGFWERVQERVLRRIESDVAQAEVSEITVLSAIRARTALHLLGGLDADGTLVTPVAPKTMEGAISAMVSLDRRVSEKRTSVARYATQARELPAERAMPGMSQVDAPMIEDGFSEVEARAVARQLALGRVGGTVAADNGHTTSGPAGPDDDGLEDE